MTDSVQFFDAQFRRQEAAREFALNPFELRALSAVCAGGAIVVNVLVEGTTLMDMFDMAHGYCLFTEAEPGTALNGWQMLDHRVEQFDAPGGTIKRFRTSIARRPAQ